MTLFFVLIFLRRIGFVRFLRGSVAEIFQHLAVLILFGGLVRRFFRGRFGCFGRFRLLDLGRGDLSLGDGFVRLVSALYVVMRGRVARIPPALRGDSLDDQRHDRRYQRNCEDDGGEGEPEGGLIHALAA